MALQVRSSRGCSIGSRVLRLAQAGLLGLVLALAVTLPPAALTFLPGLLPEVNALRYLWRGYHWCCRGKGLRYDGPRRLGWSSLRGILRRTRRRAESTGRLCSMVVLPVAWHPTRR